MSTLTTDEQALFNVAKASVPALLFQKSTSQQELLSAAAKEMGRLWLLLREWLGDAYIKTAVGIWLDQHARDRGMRRQAVAGGPTESDAALAARVRSFNDLATRSAILAAANAAAVAAGVATTSAALVELRRDRGAYGSRRMALSRGRRMGQSGNATYRPHKVIVILPYGMLQPTAVAAAVADTLRVITAGGVLVAVETRRIP